MSLACRKLLIADSRFLVEKPVVRVFNQQSAITNVLDLGAIEGTRTPTPLRVHGPEPCASANSATMANELAQQRRPIVAVSGRPTLLFYRH
jgi:hypothetical protein